MWQPEIGLKAAFNFRFTSKVTVLHGVGVGGGSQIYANVPYS